MSNDDPDHVHNAAECAVVPMTGHPLIGVVRDRPS
jgi:hypothetical protein